MNNYIAALLLERRGYVMRGRHDRVAMVDDVLRSLGHVVDVVETASIEPDVETTTRKKPTRRKKG
jgi:hypothetical protein